MIHPLRAQNILITGGTGSFGKAFVRYALDTYAARVVVFSRGEAAQAAMRAEFNDPRLRFMIGDVRDLSRLTEACRGVDIVVHAAALKRVDICELNPKEGYKTNADGTINVADACIATGVRKAVLLSTDKAASPDTTYGASKLMAERLWLSSNIYSAGTPTRFSATRYGNVLGSTGSVVPAFRKQAETGVLRVTDPTCTRFWMTMRQAVELVVHAIGEMRGGEVFVPKIQAASVDLLARAIAPQCAHLVTGLGENEKLHEELITPNEMRRTYDCGRYFIIEPESRTWGYVDDLPFGKASPDFVYRSDVVEPLSVPQLREMVAA